MDIIAEVRRRHLVSGESISSIARSLKISRPTVRKNLSTEIEPVYKRDPQPQPKLGRIHQVKTGFLLINRLDSLIAAAKSIDPLFDVNTEKLWRGTLQLGIDFMISKYDVPVDIVA